MLKVDVKNKVKTLKSVIDYWLGQVYNVVEFGQNSNCAGTDAAEVGMLCLPGGRFEDGRQ